MGRDLISELNPVWFKTLDHREHKVFFYNCAPKTDQGPLGLPIKINQSAMMYDIDILSQNVDVNLMGLCIT